MRIKPIHSDADYRATLREIENLMLAKVGSPEGERLDVLTTLVEVWEREHFPMELPDPVEAIRFMMEQRGLSAKDLEPSIGRSNRVYEVLGRKRALTLKMVWQLHEHFGLPAEAIIRPYPLWPSSQPPRLVKKRVAVQRLAPSKPARRLAAKKKTVAQRLATTSKPLRKARS